MQRALRLPPILFCTVLLLYVPNVLYPQSGDACPFSFQPEYLGEGNCFRVILRNNDPQLSPQWVKYQLLDEGMVKAGDVDPARTYWRGDRSKWYFANDKPLPPGEIDTGYACFLASVANARLEIVWGKGRSEILCRDTIQLNLPQVNEDCFAVTQAAFYCAGIRTDDEDGSVKSKSVSSAVEDWYDQVNMRLTMRNHTQSSVTGIDLSGPGCSAERDTIEVFGFAAPVPSGDYFTLNYGGYELPVADNCFFSADPKTNWGLIPLEIILHDSATNALCSDSIIVLFNSLDCIPGGVTESSSGDNSKVNLRITGLESGEALISFTLEKRSNVRLSLVDMVGNEMLRLVDDEVREAGVNKIVVNSTALPSGTYILHLQAGGKAASSVVQVAR